MMGDPLGSSRVNSQKQNREGVARAQSGQYSAMVESSPKCGEGLGRDVIRRGGEPIKFRNTMQYGLSLIQYS